MTEHLLEKGLKFTSQELNLVVGEIDRLLLNLGDEFGDIIVKEGCCPRHHLVEHHPDAPNIHFLGVRGPSEHLWCLVDWCSSNSHHCLYPLSPPASHVEIQQFEGLVFADDEVVRLDVPMDDALAVEVVDCGQDLASVVSDGLSVKRP